MTTSISPITVTAYRWSGGWDLVLDEDNATSVTHLNDAESQVRDYLDTVEPKVDHSVVPIALTVDLDGLQDEIARAKCATAQAAREQELAAARIRQVARELKRRGISSEDSATLLGISRARVYQLLSSA